MRLFCLLLLVACNVPDFANFSELGDLRIMGIVADMPEIDGSRTDSVQVVLTPYLSDILAGGRKFKVMVAGCLDPGLSQGAVPNCEQPQVYPYPNDNAFDTEVLADSNYTGAMDAVTITINNPAAMLSPFSPQQRFNGVNYLVVLRLEHEQTNLTAVKAITITERQKLNTNPELEKIVMDEQALNANPLAPIDIDVSLKGEQETYREMRADGTLATVTESYFITWFYTGRLSVRIGVVLPSRVLLGQSATYYPVYSDDYFKMMVIAVVKDRRGGTAVSIKHMPKFPYH